MVMELPKADLYVCTGNMLPSFWSKRGSVYCFSKIQTIYMQTRVATAGINLRQYMGNPDAPVIVCRGDRDFTNLFSLFGGEVYEIGRETKTINPGLNYGLNVAGFRGVRTGDETTSDRIMAPDEISLVAGIDDKCDILVTHVPPKGHLDQEPAVEASGCGLTRLTTHLDKIVSGTRAQPSNLSLHLFGQDKGYFGTKRLGEPGKSDITLGNACGGWIKFEGRLAPAGSRLTWNVKELKRLKKDEPKKSYGAPWACY